jgi:glutathione-regulated potassium-efflux system ancillary protein kefF
MPKALIVYGHPTPELSTANAETLRVVTETLGENVEVRELASHRVNGSFDIAAEQQALMEADVIVLQFPVFWYSVPALLKQWLDDVFTYGFAYGSDGDKLAGKTLVVAASAGANAEIYAEKLPNNFPEIFNPLENTAAFSRMKWAEPVYVYSALSMPGTEDIARSAGVDLGQQLVARLRELNI